MTPAQQAASDFITESNLIDFNIAEGVILQLHKQFYPPHEAGTLFNRLSKTLAWQEEKIHLYGRWITVPRLMCWYGDADAYYGYSGVNHKPLPWTLDLQSIRIKISQQCQCDFNSVLANLYRDGKDSMGCHADNEKELGINPTIASLSLGEERLFKMHHKKSGQSLDIPLQQGDLLVMAGTCQHYWVHSVPKTKASKTPRINLTFRKIIPAEDLIEP